MKTLGSIEVSSARRHQFYRHRYYHYHAWRGYRPYYGYYDAYNAYAYDPYYYGRGPGFYVGPFGFGIGVGW